MLYWNRQEIYVKIIYYFEGTWWWITLRTNLTILTRYGRILDST
jgi:hypothetical protein